MLLIAKRVEQLQLRLPGKEGAGFMLRMHTHQLLPEVLHKRLIDERAVYPKTRAGFCHLPRYHNFGRLLIDQLFFFEPGTNSRRRLEDSLKLALLLSDPDDGGSGFGTK